MTLQNISLVVPMDNVVTYVCNRQACVLEYTLGGK